MKNEMCVYGEGTPQHKLARYLIQMYIDVVGGVTTDTPFVMSQSRVTKSVTFKS